MAQYVTRNFLINTSHWVPGTNRYRYQLQGSNHIHLPQGSEISVASISLYNYCFNVSNRMGNNQLVIVYPGFNINSINSLGIPGVLAVSSYTDPVSGYNINSNCIIITFVDSYLDIPSFNNYLQNIFLLIKFYLTVTAADGSQSQEVFINVQTNPTQYKCQWNIFPLTHTLAAGLSLPSGNTFVLPGLGSSCPSVYFPANNLPYGSIAQIFGFPSGIIGGGSTSLSILSTTYPQVNPISTLIFQCNLVYNDLCVPNNMLCQFPIRGSYGSIMQDQLYPNFISCLEIKTNYIEIQLFDNFLNQLQVVDPEFSITLMIRLPRVQQTQR